MHVAFDAVMLAAYLHPAAAYPKKIDRIPERIQGLVDELEASGAKIIVPTPVLSEFLVLAGDDGPTYLSDLTTSDVFDVRPFDTVAAIEAAALHRKARSGGDKRSGARGRWQVVKVDRQFVAIAKVNGVACIYSDDSDMEGIAAAAGIVVKGIGDLPAPPPIQEELLLMNVDTSTSPTSSSEPQQVSADPRETAIVEPAGASDQPAHPRKSGGQVVVPNPLPANTERNRSEV